MLNNQGHASEKTQLLPPASRAAGAANGAWVDVRKYEGTLVVLCESGAVTGSSAFKVQDATDASGTGAADVTGASITALAANSVEAIVVEAGAVRGWIRVVNTVTTGPVLSSAALLSTPKYI